MQRISFRMLAVAILWLFGLSLVQADSAKLMPFVLASTGNGNMASTVTQVKKKLTSNGFTIVGTYSPYANATIICVTNAALKQDAAKTDFGAFGAAQRVTVTKVGSELQIAYTNPVYMAAAYEMKANLSPVAASLRAALGYQKAYGSEEGLTADDLEDYHYKWLMPYFTDRLKLASYGSYQDAIKHVEKGLAAKKGGVSQVYRIDIPGKKTSVFGVHMTHECSGDKYIMSRIDFKPIKSTGHLPYEMVVKGDTVYALPAEFRIAINFPDLSMIGSNSFASIMCAPNAIQKALTAAAGGSMSSSF